MNVWRILLVGHSNVSAEEVSAEEVSAEEVVEDDRRSRAMDALFDDTNADDAAAPLLVRIEEKEVNVRRDDDSNAGVEKARVTVVVVAHVHESIMVAVEMNRIWCCICSRACCVLCMCCGVFRET
mmetsp:Transcript_26093/g.47365  ORF Transcript_26093/g.47365 Transcript_26093/m.47365 type:complete len:125 (-) Transcript_26093:71-445(-)